MRKIALWVLIGSLHVSLAAQTDQPESFGKGSQLYQNSRPHPTTDRGSSFNPQWAPFYHGVASGDPRAESIVLWTRLTPDTITGENYSVSWTLASDPDLSDIVQEGTATTNTDRDLTVKIEVNGLSPGTTYYYGFRYDEQPSLTGRTRTTPTADQSEHLKFGVVSCANYQSGYFNAYGRLAERNDLDAVIHLGDYIYEYANFVYGNEQVWDDRPVEPEDELVELPEYRARYSTYRLDTNLIRLHQQHPIISVWDDHESANDSYRDGASNHQAFEGPWEERKAIAKQTYFEWMPIRDYADEKIYRTISYGNLMDLILLDTRLEGRDAQPTSISDPDFFDPARTLLGAEQKQWFFDQLTGSTATWTIVGQQVLLSELNIGWGALVAPLFSYEGYENVFLDIWDGYPAERDEVLQFIGSNELDNVVVLTGDFHTSFAIDVPADPVEVVLVDTAGLTGVPLHLPTDYDPTTGSGSLLVEFVTPSVTSANFDENVGPFAPTFEAQINAPLVSADGIDLGNPNPHMKYVNLTQHGYYVLDVKPDSVQADYFFTPILSPTEDQEFATAFYTRTGENHLNPAGGPAPPKVQQEEPAPANPPGTVATGLVDHLLLLSLYPNPATDRQSLQFALNTAADTKIELVDRAGRTVQILRDERLAAGIYLLTVDVSELPAGAYFYRLTVGNSVRTVKAVRL